MSKKIRIAVNTRLLQANKLEGIGWFSFETLKRITAAHPEIEFHYIFDGPFSKEFITSSNIHPHLYLPPTRHPKLWHWWLEYSLPFAFSRIKPDLFLSPDGFLSLRSKVPQVPVIHDINFEHRPQDCAKVAADFYRHYFPLFAQKATRIATVSQFSAQDIVNTYGIPADKIDVVYNGYNESYGPVDFEIREQVKKKVSKGKPYFLYVGSINPRKNVVNLLKAYEQFCERQGEVCGLVLAGAVMHENTEEEAYLWEMKHRKMVHFAGRVSVQELKDLLGSAFALTYVPWFEGFGIPLLEAMAAEIPIITSNTSSLPEVAGEAALYAGPDDTEAIALHMETLWLKPGVRNELIEAGKLKRMQFNWDKSADLLWQTLEKTFGHAHSIVK